MLWNVLGKKWERLGTFGKKLGKNWEKIGKNLGNFYISSFFCNMLSNFCTTAKQP